MEQRDWSEPYLEINKQLRLLLDAMNQKRYEDAWVIFEKIDDELNYLKGCTPRK